MARRARKKKPIEVKALKYKEAKRKNIPTAEFEPVMADADKSPIHLAYERRNRDLDPQLVWRGKDEQDWSDLVVYAPPLYIQEKVHPKVLIDDLLRLSKERREEDSPETPDLFADFNGLADPDAVTDFYQHDQNWSNRMILGDGLQVMASLAEREGLRGQVQCIYIDPPYGIKFNSNFQWSTASRDVKDNNAADVTREPEQVKAFRDTWRDGIHSYLTYLRDRLTVARDLLADSGSIFVQIGDENVHRVRSLMDEVLGENNFIAIIPFRTKTRPLGGQISEGMIDFVIHYAKNKETVKFRTLYEEKNVEGDGNWKWVEEPDGTRRLMSKQERENHKLLPSQSRVYRTVDLRPAGFNESQTDPYLYQGTLYPPPGNSSWLTNSSGLARLDIAGRLQPTGPKGLERIYFHDDYPVTPLTNLWKETRAATDKRYVVQTSTVIVSRCVLMTTDPCDLVLDPTCGSGTAAYVAEQWGRRWITIDTSRVALALARARIMGARYPYYLLADSPEGQKKEAEATRTAPRETPTHGDIRQGFVYERVPHITLKSIANNAEIDVIWERFRETLEPLRERLNKALGENWEEWEIPREAGGDWPKKAKDAHAEWWKNRIARQKEIDASIAAKADHEYLYDKPYADNARVRVAGPFTVESLSPHRTLAVDENDELVDGPADGLRETGPGQRYDGPAPERDFAEMVLENLKIAGVQQAHKEDKIDFTAIAGWSGRYICAEGRYVEGGEEQEAGSGAAATGTVKEAGSGDAATGTVQEAGSGDAATGTIKEKRAGVFIGPEFGTVARPDLVAAAREAADAGFDVLVACAFNFDAHSAEFDKLGRIPVLKARMNPDLHMADELKNTGQGDLFVVFGEPDIEILDIGGGKKQVRIKGVDVFHPQTGEISSSGPDGIACWFIDTDYNEESFFVRHAYFLGASDPYKALKTTLKAEIDEAAWETLHSDTSRPFDKPSTGRIAVKVINHLGDEVMKVFSVG